MNKELKKLIDQYCMGVKPTEAQEIEIFDKVAETGADIKEVSSYMAEMQNGPTQEERIAAQEAERKAKEEAERKAKEEAERKAKEKAEKEAKEKAEREAKKEAERKAKEEAERETKKEANTNNKVSESKKESVAPSKPAPKEYSKKRTVERKAPAKRNETKATSGTTAAEERELAKPKKKEQHENILQTIGLGIVTLLVAYGAFYNVRAIINHTGTLWENILWGIVCLILTVICSLTLYFDNKK